MWYLNIFYFLTIFIACFSAQNFLPEQYGKFILLFLILIGFLLKPKIKNSDSPLLSMMIFLLFALYSAFQGLDPNTSVPLVIGLFFLYLFVKNYVDSLSPANIKTLIIVHTGIINLYILITLIAIFFFPAWLNYQPGNFHPYGGLNRIPATSAAILFGGLFFNTLCFLTIQKRLLKLICIFFFIFTLIIMSLLGSRTADLSTLLYLAILYLVSLGCINDNNLKYSLIKYALFCLPCIIIAILAFYVLGHLEHYSQLGILHQGQDYSGNFSLLDGRSLMWSSSFYSFINSPYIWNGVGYGNHFYFAELNRFNYTTLHNITLDILYDTGVLGCVLFLSFIMLTYINILKNYLLTQQSIHFIFFVSLLIMFIQSQGESSLDSLLTTHFYLYFLFYTLSMRLTKINKPL